MKFDTNLRLQHGHSLDMAAEHHGNVGCKSCCSRGPLSERVMLPFSLWFTMAAVKALPRTLGMDLRRDTTTPSEQL